MVEYEIIKNIKKISLSKKNVISLIENKNLDIKINDFNIKLFKYYKYTTNNSIKDIIYLIDNKGNLFRSEDFEKDLIIFNVLLVKDISLFEEIIHKKYLINELSYLLKDYDYFLIENGNRKICITFFKNNRSVDFKIINSNTEKYSDISIEMILKEI